MWLLGTDIEFLYTRFGISVFIRLSTWLSLDFHNEFR